MRDNFRAQYARACELRADWLVDELIEIANGVTPENANASRVKADIHKWMASRLLPKKYGDRINANIQHGVS